MRRRCSNPKDNSFARYGGVGIKVCPLWMSSFRAFYADMGPRPSCKHSIERLNGKGNYEPSNCVWATADIQARNRKSTVWVAISGRTLCLKDWCAEYGISAQSVRNRIARGFPIEEAITTPTSGIYRGFYRSK